MAETRNVRVFRPKSADYLTDLGKTVTPAGIPELDFEILDRALATENTIANKSLETMQANIDKLGSIQDEITGISVSNPYQKAKLEAIKKNVGIDQSTVSSALTRMDNPVALYDLDRKMKRLISNPVVNEIMQESAMIQHFRENITQIEDPHMRAKAMMDLQAVMADRTGEYRATGLNLSQYRSIDVGAAYKEIIENLAPSQTQSEDFVGADGRTGVRSTESRDPKAMAQARKLFMENPAVRNNLIARGILDKDGNEIKSDRDGNPDPNGQSFFDIIEEGMAVTNTDIKYYKGPSRKKSKDGKVFSPELSAEGSPNWTPDIVTSGESEFDLGFIYGQETGSREPATLIHVDKGGANAINIGVFSFNGGVSGGASPFIKYLESKHPDNANIKALKKINLRDKNNIDLARDTYMRIQDQIGEEALASLEKEFAVSYYGDQAVKIAKAHGIETLSLGESTLLMDTAIQFGADDVEKWMKAYEKDDEGKSLIEYITRKRGSVNNGAYEDRALAAGNAAMALDNKGFVESASASGAGGATAPVSKDPYEAQPSDYKAWNLPEVPDASSVPLTPPDTSGTPIGEATQQESEIRTQAAKLWDDNSDLPFVKRWKQGAGQPFIPTPGGRPGDTSTHLMAHDKDENGDWYVYPRITMEDGKLKPGNTLERAKESGNVISVPNEDVAYDLARNYKEIDPPKEAKVDSVGKSIGAAPELEKLKPIVADIDALFAGRDSVRVENSDDPALIAKREKAFDDIIDARVDSLQAVAEDREEQLRLDIIGEKVVAEAMDQVQAAAALKNTVVKIFDSNSSGKGTEIHIQRSKATPVVYRVSERAISSDKKPTLRGQMSLAELRSYLENRDPSKSYIAKFDDEKLISDDQMAAINDGIASIKQEVDAKRERSIN